MKQIWKYNININENTTIDMQKKAIVVRVKESSNNDINLWAIVDPKAGTEKRHFDVKATGEDIPEDTRIYLGICTFKTTLVSVPFLMWHVFEILDGVIKKEKNKLVKQHKKEIIL